MTTVYKLTDDSVRTHGGYQWVPGEWHETSGDGDLCGPGWLHCYAHPLLAVLLNPIGAKYGSRMRLWEAEAEGEHLDDRGLKSGWSRMRLVREIAVPVVTTEQRVTIAIMCGLRLYRDPAWVWWAHGWLDGTDRSAAAAARAAAAAAAVTWGWEAAQATAGGLAAAAAAEAALATLEAEWPHSDAASRAAAAVRASVQAGTAIDLISIAEEACNG